jgi:hypothetical protein
MTAASAMSSASRKGSLTVPTGNATSPDRTSGRKDPSVKFWVNQLQRSTVTSAPDAWTIRSARSASSSPRPESSTRRWTPA